MPLYFEKPTGTKDLLPEKSVSTKGLVEKLKAL